MNRATIAACLIVFVSPLAVAQEFEAASVRPSAPAGPGRGMRADPGLINMTGVTLNFLLQQAYDVREYQISGGPNWVNSDRYDIVAKLPDSTENQASADFAKFTDDQAKNWLHRRQAMLQALLADRFELKIHRETKELPRYVLTVAKGGPKLKNAGQIEASNVGHGMINMGRGSLWGSQIPVSDLILALSQIMGRTILDQTGLNGKFDFNLKWTPDQSTAGLSGVGLPPPGADAAPLNPEGPSIFTALQEQLGLKLDSGKGPVEVIVIDHAGKPSAN